MPPVIAIDASVAAPAAAVPGAAATGNAGVAGVFAAMFALLGGAAAVPVEGATGEGATGNPGEAGVPKKAAGEDPAPAGDSAAASALALLAAIQPATPQAMAPEAAGAAGGAPAIVPVDGLADAPGGAPAIFAAGVDRGPVVPRNEAAAQAAPAPAATPNIVAPLPKQPMRDGVPRGEASDPVPGDVPVQVTGRRLPPGGTGQPAAALPIPNEPAEAAPARSDRSPNPVGAALDAPAADTDEVAAHHRPHPARTAPDDPAAPDEAPGREGSRQAGLPVATGTHTVPAPDRALDDAGTPPTAPGQAVLSLSQAPRPASVPAIMHQPPAAVPVPAAGLAGAIAQHAAGGATRFDIRLDPPELGRVEVRLDIGHDGRVHSHLVVERHETLDLLKADARGLERALEQAGLKSDPGAMSFSLRDDRGGGAQGWQQQQPQPRAPLAMNDGGHSEPARPQQPGFYRDGARASGGIDITV